MLRLILEDDKVLVVLALTVIGLASIFSGNEPPRIVDQIVSGLLGVAVGKNLRRG